MFFFFQKERPPCEIIDYRDIYNCLKDKPADKWTRELDQFHVLNLWRLNDRRNDNK